VSTGDRQFYVVPYEYIYRETNNTRAAGSAAIYWRAKLEREAYSLSIHRCLFRHNWDCCYFPDFFV